ncbi:hypothetical protein GQ42DRAFT_91107 [Ramicandelaber brevisporus]|nr:hypothetical protein GQ42DRAFT_91107 [Ramicandelaber brevisporus]
MPNVASISVSEYQRPFFSCFLLLLFRTLLSLLCCTVAGDFLFYGSFYLPSPHNKNIIVLTLRGIHPYTPQPTPKLLPLHTSYHLTLLLFYSSYSASLFFLPSLGLTPLTITTPFFFFLFTAARSALATLLPLPLLLSLP